MLWDGIPGYISRRKMLEMCGMGLGSVALASRGRRRIRQPREGSCR